jgi:DNA-binding NarL/FixJ family response regulator
LGWYGAYAPATDGQGLDEMTPSDKPTPAELRAFRAYLKMGSAKAAAASLGLAESTIKGELATLRSKCGVHRTAQLVLILHDRIAA